MLGARRHYAVPRILHQAGLLACFYTDVVATQGWPRWLRSTPDSLLPQSLQRLKNRVPAGIPMSRIRSFPWFGSLHVFRRSHSRGAVAAARENLRAADVLAQKIIAQPTFDPRHILYTFDRAGLALMRYVKAHGGFAIMEQTAVPLEVYQASDAEERIRFPKWSNEPAPPNLGFLAERERAEWDLADLIICGSDYVHAEIGRCGGPVERCHVVPSGVAMPMFAQIKRGEGMRFSGNSQPLKVLFVGSVNLNKGVPYVLDVARRLGDLIQVRMVGQLGVSAYGVSQLEQHVELLGPVPRGKVWEHYAWADVFFLPSLNEGSALVTYEALLSGLPVVCTPNTGSMVRDGFNGIIVPARDVVTMCEVLTRLATDTSYLEYLRANVAASRDDCSLSCYGERLIRCIEHQDPAGIHRRSDR